MLIDGISILIFIIMLYACSTVILPEKAGGRQEQTPGINLHRQTSGKYRIWNVKEPHGIPGAGEKNRGRNCLKEAVGTYIMEKRTADESPLCSFSAIVFGSLNCRTY